MTFRWRGYCCTECRERITNEADAHELVRARDEKVIGIFCTSACMDAFTEVPASS